MTSIPRITNARQVPVVSTDAHLPAVNLASLQPAALRQRFSSPPAWDVEHRGDGRLMPDRTPAAASVLVALVPQADGELAVLLTQRTERLRNHAGQVSFPGGRAEACDADAAATALREAEEEVGLSPAAVEVIGELPLYTTVTNFQVTPVVGLLNEGLDWRALRLDADEVDEAFLVPLHYLMNPAHHRRHRFDYEGGSRNFLSMPWEGLGSRGEPREFFIWGATAAMLRNLYRFLAA